MKTTSYRCVGKKIVLPGYVLVVIRFKGEKFLYLERGEKKETTSDVLAFDKNVHVRL